MYIEMGSLGTKITQLEMLFAIVMQISCRY